MKDLETCRKEIDEIDQQIIELFEKRMGVCKDVVDYKKQHHLPIFQPEREKQVIQRNLQYLKNKDLELYARKLIYHMMSISKSYQSSFLNPLEMDLNDKKKNIVLIGIMGCGKTTLSKELGHLLNKEVIDMDDYIVERFNMTIQEMFDISEEYFRERESICCRELSLKEDCIIATGGGVVTRKENIDELKKNSFMIYIDRPVDEIIKEVDVLSRPLLKDGPRKLYEIYKQRHHLYLDACDVHLINDSSKDDIIKKIIEVM